ncbi:MAG: hypothetical protein ACRDHV_00995 [Actinomycetota bacterium]
MERKVHSTGRGWVRPVVAMAVLGVATASLLIAPVRAHTNLSKGHVRFAHQAGEIQTIHYRRSDPVPITQDEYALTIVNCPRGTRVVGGGLVGTVNGVELVSMHPSNGTFSGAGFTAMAFNALNISNTDQTYRAYAICVKSTTQNANFSAGDSIV